MRKRRTIHVAVVLLLLLGVLVTLRWSLSSRRLRRNWKDQIVVEVARLATDREWIGRQTAAIEKQLSESPHENGTWVGQQIVVMKDGQWVVFKSECVHRHQLLGDIFIGEASNGRWYYSSFHFCCEMVVPRMNDQPADLDAFIRDYCLREFDGKSDEAIEPTWTPGSSPIG
jgi:hypothetical protein